MKVDRILNGLNCGIAPRELVSSVIGSKFEVECNGRTYSAVVRGKGMTTLKDIPNTTLDIFTTSADLNDSREMLIFYEVEVGSIVENDFGQGKHSERIIAHAVYAPDGENADWAKATPSLHLDMQVDNPNAWGKIKQGQEYYVDFTPVRSIEGD